MDLEYRVWVYFRKIRYNSNNNNNNNKFFSYLPKIIQINLVFMQPLLLSAIRTGTMAAAYGLVAISPQFGRPRPRGLPLKLRTFVLF